MNGNEGSRAVDSGDERERGKEDEDRGKGEEMEEDENAGIRVTVWW